MRKLTRGEENVFRTPSPGAYDVVVEYLHTNAGNMDEVQKLGFIPDKGFIIVSNKSVSEKTFRERGCTFMSKDDSMGTKPNLNW
jgi:hypothetical protein